MRFVSIQCSKMRLRTPLGELTALSQIQLVLRRPRRGGAEEREGEGRGGEAKGRRGAGRERKRRGGKVDSDAQLEQGRRLAKAGSDFSPCSQRTTL